MVYVCIVVYMLTHTFYEVKWWWWRRTIRSLDPHLPICSCLMCLSCGVTCAVYLEICKENVVDRNHCWHKWLQSLISIVLCIYLSLNIIYYSMYLCIISCVSLKLPSYQVYVSKSINPPHEQMCSPAEPNGCNPGGVTTTQANNTLNQLDWICFNSNQKTKQHSWTSKWRLSLNLSSFIDSNSNKIKNGTLPGTVTYPTKTGRSEQTVIVPKLFLWNKHTPNAPWCHNLPPWLLHFFG